MPGVDWIVCGLRRMCTHAPTFLFRRVHVRALGLGLFVVVCFAESGVAGYSQYTGYARPVQASAAIDALYARSHRKGGGLMRSWEANHRTGLGCDGRFGRVGI